MQKWKQTIKLKHLLGPDTSPEAIKKLAQGALGALQNTSAPCAGFEKALKLADEDEEVALLVVNDAMNTLYDWANANRVWIA